MSEEEREKRFLCFREKEREKGVENWGCCLDQNVTFGIFRRWPITHYTTETGKRGTEAMCSFLVFWVFFFFLRKNKKISVS